MGLLALELTNKVAIVTGSTKGIGYGIASGLAEAGAKVVVNSRNQEDCQRVADEISRKYGVEAVAFNADVTMKEQVDKMVNEVVKNFGRIDVLVNNAGTTINKTAEEITEEEWNHVTDINLKSIFFVAQTVGKQMIAQQEGKIINVASFYGLVGEKNILPYCVSKGGVIQMTKALALEWAKFNVQVNALCPGYVKTSMNEANMEEVSIYTHIIRSTPMRRLGTIEEMQGPAVFLASPASSFMTGQTLVVDGGWTAQ